MQIWGQTHNFIYMTISKQSIIAATEIHGMFSHVVGRRLNNYMSVVQYTKQPLVCENVIYNNMYNEKHARLLQFNIAYYVNV